MYTSILEAFWLASFLVDTEERTVQVGDESALRSQKMMRASLAPVVLIAVVSLAIGWNYGSVASAQGNQHGYFNALVSRAEHWKSYSLRDPAQLECKKDGGYAVSCNDEKGVTYSPANDTDPHRQDAAKVTIPAFNAGTTVLTQPASANATVLTIQPYSASVIGEKKVIKIDQEVMTIIKRDSDTTISVVRGDFGTTPAAHAAGAAVKRNSNSLTNQVRVPLKTEDGHSYLFTWDAYWTDSYMNMWPMAHKAFQFGSGGSGGNQIWLEPQTDFTGLGEKCFDRSVHVFSAQFRSYNGANSFASWLLTNGNQVGPGTTNSQLNPKSGQFCGKPNTWTRWWVRINQRVNDWDDLDVWLADETTEAVRVLSGLKISVPTSGPTPNQIADFWLEFNTSTSTHLRLDQRDLVAYVRNFVALRDVGEVQNLLVRPVPGAQPVAGPAAPMNLRIISGD
jgi:hypothetical protein